jgi:hypothetical protein
MNTAKEILFNLIDEIPENEMAEVIDFIEYLKTKREKELFKGLQKASESSISFWENDKDDEVWNNV